MLIRERQKDKIAKTTILKIESHMGNHRNKKSIGYEIINGLTSQDLGSNLSECQIFHVFRCVLSSLLHLRCVGRSNFDKGLHNLIMLIKKDIE